MKAAVSAVNAWLTATLTAEGIAALWAAIQTSILSAAMAVLEVVTGAAAAMLAFFTTPLGLIVLALAAVTAALAAGAVWFFGYTEAGQFAVSTLTNLLTGLWQTATQTFQGIFDAIMAGRWDLAANVAMAGLNLAWQKGVFALKSLWAGFKEWLIGLFADMFAAIFQKLADFQASLVGGVNFIREKLGFNPIEGFAGIDALADQEKRRAEAIKRIAAIGKDAEMSAAQKKVDAAQAELDKATGEAKAARQEKADKRKAAFKGLLDGLGSSQSSNVTSPGGTTLGTFSGAIAGLLGRSGPDDATERTADATEAMEEHLDAIRRKVEAFSRFGPGEGCKPKAEGSTYPYWSLDDFGAGYMQESADIIHACTGWLKSFDTRHECKDLVEACLSVAYDQGRSRWYSSIVTRWEYLPALDEAIAQLKRASVLRSRPAVQQANSPPSDDAWFYLSATYDESMFNHDPGTLGTVVGDPNYYPLDNGVLYFFKVQGEHFAQRLVRLFDRGVKPHVVREDETRVRVSFSCQRVDSFDEDDVFLIEEEIAAAKAESERLDRQWELQQRPARRAGRDVVVADEPIEPRPLSGEMLSSPRLFDQATRWLGKLSVSQSATPDESESQKTGNVEGETSPPVEPASDEMLRLALPLAVMSAAGLRDLVRIRYYYPSAIPEDEARSLHDGFAANLKSAAEICKLERVFEIGKIPTFEEGGSDAELSVVMGVLSLWHPDTKGDPSDPDVSKNMEAAIRKCQEDVTEPVRGMIERLIHATLYDCRVPMPKGDKSFEEPQRFLQMLRSYWGVVRQLVLHHIDSPVGLRPHPLMPLVVNLKARIDACFDKLANLNGAEDVRQQVTTLIDIVLSGEPDDLQVVPEWSYDQVGGVNRFIEEGRLALGAKTYPLTPPEETCLSYANKAIQDYEQQVKTHWSRMLKRIDAKREEQAKPNSAPAEQASSPKKDVPMEPQPFVGGAMVYSSGRVEFCGIEICSGSRRETRRRILNVLKVRRDGRFVAYSGEELAAAVELEGGAKSVPGAIRELRDEISNSLGELNIVCGKFEVIVNDRSGYHFADCVTVQEVDPPGSPPITDTGTSDDVRNVREHDVPDVLDDASAGRKAWIMRRIEEGHQLKGPDVVRQFACSDKTAQRDLAALKDDGKIEFVGAARTGYYRLCQTPQQRQ